MYRFDFNQQTNGMRLVYNGGTVEGYRVAEDDEQKEAPISNSGEMFSISGVATEDEKKQASINNNGGSSIFGTMVHGQSNGGGTFSPRVHKQRRIEEDGEDRLSMLPNDLIYYIFSFINTKYAVQTSVLSTRWKNVWKFIPFLNLSVVYFNDFTDFSRFVINVISYRDYDSDVSTLNLFFTLKSDFLLINTVIGYAISHNCQKLLVNNYFEDYRKIRHSVFFDCPSLKHLALYRVANATLSAWNLPALTSLFLESVSFRSWYQEAPDEGLFSEFLNLKNLTLVNCYVRSKSLNFLQLSSVSIETLKIKNSSCAFKTDACTVVVSMPNLLFFQYEGYRPLCFSMNDSKHLDEVKISLRLSQMTQAKKQVTALEFVAMLNQFRSVKYLALFVSPFRFLSVVSDLLKHQPFPFPHLKHLSVEQEATRSNSTAYKNEMGAIYADLMTYFRGSSPSAAVIEYRRDDDNYVPDNAFVQAEKWEWTVRTSD